LTQCFGGFVEDAAAIDDIAGADEAAAVGHLMNLPLASLQDLASATPPAIARTTASIIIRFIGHPLVWAARLTPIRPPVKCACASD
jgi:hypothetical protein